VVRKRGVTGYFVKKVQPWGVAVLCSIIGFGPVAKVLNREVLFVDCVASWEERVAPIPLVTAVSTIGLLKNGIRVEGTRIDYINCTAQTLFVIIALIVIAPDYPIQFVMARAHFAAVVGPVRRY